MRNLVPHDKRVKLKDKPMTVGSMTQVYYEPVDASFGRKAWITHFKGESGWGVAGCLTQYTDADTPGGMRTLQEKLKKSDAIAAAVDYIING